MIWVDYVITMNYHMAMNVYRHNNHYYLSSLYEGFTPDLRQIIDMLSREYLTPYSELIGMLSNLKPWVGLQIVEPYHWATLTSYSNILYPLIF